MTEDRKWGQFDPALVQWLYDHRHRAIKVYRANPLLVAEHANQEDSYRTGGYAQRQLLELVQNAADALHRSGSRGRVELRLTRDALYCANEGEPFTQAGLEAVCHAFLSPKRGEEIGRFGLGFKSVLGVSQRPAVFSRSICFDFDAERSRTELLAIAPLARRFPVLRLPSLLDAEHEMKTDETLRDLASWAQTVIRLRLSNDRPRLEQEMRDFPSEFLLFVPNVSVLHLVIEGDVGSRFEVEHRCVELPTGDLRLEGDASQQADWRVWHRTHRPSEQALAEVGEAVRREEVRVSYAVPLADAQQLGRFWAYFPLADETSARGIINAPWRVNDDRTNLLSGVFNNELFDVAAEMIVAGVTTLTTGEDLARHFDYLPARGREAHNDADRYLTERVPRIAAQTRCVPDADGQLQLPKNLRLPHFDLRLELPTHRAWHEAPGRPAQVPHWSCYQTATRRARLRSLVRAEDMKVSDSEVGADEWLELIVPDGTDEQCRSALQILATVRDDLTRRDMQAASVLPDTSGRLRRLDETDQVFLRGHVLSSTAGLSLVRGSFLNGRGVEDALRNLGFRDVDPALELRKLLKKAGRDWGDYEWTAFWELVDEVSVADAQRLLEEHVALGGRLCVRCLDRSWHVVGNVVVPAVVKPRRASLALDTEFHDLHLTILRAVGVDARPTVTRAALLDPTYMEYVRNVREQHLRDLPPLGRPDPGLLHFDNEAVGPLHMLRRFADTDDPASLEAWTRELLNVDAPERTRLRHRNHRLFPNVREVQAPHLWAARTYGRFATDWGSRRAEEAVGRGLARYSPLLPVAHWESTAKLSLPKTLVDVSAVVWREFLTRAPAEADPWSLGQLLTEAARCLVGETPLQVPALSEASGVLAAPDEVLLARTEEELRALSGRRLPYVAVAKDEDADLLIDRWGCREASAQLRVQVVAEMPGEPVVLLDRFRALRALAGGGLDGFELVECQGLAREITAAGGIDREPIDFAQDGNTVFYLASLEDEELLGRLAGEFDLRLTTMSIARILSDAQDEQIRSRMATCRIERDPAKKLLTLVDSRVLESKLPAGLLQAVRHLGDNGGDYQLAELLLHVHGYDVLRELRHELQEAGFPVPTQWAGSAPAISFVRQLGLPAEYAGERGQRLEADLTVPGPPDLNPLHPYQEKLAGDIRQLIKDPDRALLFLPTGAGKTRVTVQALVHAFVEDGLNGPLLWIAQSEELCEQAVQTWSVVWRQFGDRRPLRLSRLWDRNEVAPSDDEVMVVVATDAKLAICRDKDDYDWLSQPSMVVIDEAHVATGKDYTATLRWLGLDHRKTTRPLLGLTATPFKGTGGEEANIRLATRFDKRLLDALGEDPYAALQAQGVLSRVEHRILDGANLELDAQEREYALRTRQLPQGALDRLGKDQARTQRLLEDIGSLPDEWPVLVFTASVLSAQVLAALLRVRGIGSAAVSGATRTQERRRSIEAFRAGDIRVLTNCNVLTQGFDAPSVRALYIARPTFSPNAYIQMVGRGLRGPANGGKEACLVVNVADTFGQFGERLAYQKFDYLWERQGGRLR
ncbi:DEAD/DEAH box helicase family protein [Verrucosispora sp. WMMA2044]|uniref:sacsin N-terminal ATP-binding-like domain-containing protein n=1 Tax=Verrucosispora sp. WMMA2044 TaxID=3016419 RepID=UPI00248D2F69|nr:DEAD/DEAH box helicase family protein [Verrucosispora sp. WMMA2044]WBB47440.1 DEAD/DEAH box helicase family protein [Verrucosispora sp. WMMA2044]